MELIQANPEPWLKIKEGLSRDDYDLVNELQELCMQHDKITLKLELDYKLGAALTGSKKDSLNELNEFMYFIGNRLIGYIGICCFGGNRSPLEITGMVHPDYRRRGIFTLLYKLVMSECIRRSANGVFGLCDRNSASGQSFLTNAGAAYNYSEYEMYLRGGKHRQSEGSFPAVCLRKAKNADAAEIARQNLIYFGEGEQDSDVTPQIAILPEEEEKRGMTIYLAEKDSRIIGKVHLQLINGLGGIYGLGVLPAERGRGCGRAILIKAIEKLKEAEAGEIMLQVAAANSTALSLYKSCGFCETSVMDYYDMI